MARVLIAGCGYVGTALGLRLAAAGHEVHALRRRAESIPPELNGISADLLGADLAGRLPRGAEFVFYTASAGGGDEAAYQRAYIDAPANLLRALDPSSLRRVFFVSSTGVYGQHAGEVVDEDSPTEPESATGRVLVRAERAIANFGFPVTVVRFSGIYGPGRTSLARRLLAGNGSAGQDAGFTNRIHRDDCAAALAHLMSLVRPGNLYLASDMRPATRGEVREWLQARFPGARSDATPTHEAATGRRGVGSKRCICSRLVRSGFEFLYPSYREGYAALADEIRAGGY